MGETDKEIGMEALKSERKSLRMIGAEVIVECKGDREKAVKKVIRIIKNTPGIREKIIENAAKEAVGLGIHDQRHKSWVAAKRREPNEDSNKGMLALAESRGRDHLKTWILQAAPIAIGKASRDEIEKEWHHYDKIVRSNIKPRTFFRKLLDAMGDHQFVEDAIANEDIDRLLLEAEKECEDL